VKWHPYALDPTLPKEGVDKLTRYNKKFGADRVKQIIPHMKSVGKKHGINFSYGGKIANTLDSHRVIHLAAQHDKEDAMVEELFKNYFEEEKSIGDHAVLEAAAAKVGVPGVPALLKSDRFAESVKAEIADCSSKRWGRVTGVPFFVIDQKFALSGAQEPEAFMDVFKKCLAANM